MRDEGVSRRELFRRGGNVGSLVVLSALLRGESARAATAAADTTRSTGLRVGKDIYQSIGVRPMINARGTYTIISGSVMLPEVRDAIAEAAKHYVHLDELAEAVGARLAALTKAEWGMVSSGCAAGLTHATAACVAGGNPDLHVRIPDVSRFPKDEVIIPKHSRNVYDAAVRAVGVRVIEVETVAELEAALGPRTAMVYVLAGPAADKSPLHTKAIATLAEPRGVPILVDAAAEILTIPNVHLQNGATLVAYSGGKCLRGPQTGGLVLGRKDLVRAAWVHSAPHHGFARGLKVGKEEAIGMLMAVEMWVNRDHDGEWKRWTSWLEHIASRVSDIDGVTTAIVQPEGLSNRTPSVKLLWKQEQLGMSGETASRALFDGEPRIALHVSRGDDDPSLTGVMVTPYMMADGDEQIVADRLHELLSNPKREASTAPATPVTDLSGLWEVQIEFAASRSTHMLHLTQRGNEINGAHQGEFVSRDLSGTIDGDTVELRSRYTERHGDSLNFTFSGSVTGDEMGGTLDMGEYLDAKWTATRRVNERRG